MSREKLPDRRVNWTAEAVIENQNYFLTCGEYPDGRLGEIFINGGKPESFTAGVLDSLARMTSLSLQCGASASDVVGILRGMNFPPNALVSGSHATTVCSSLVDWIAQEVAHVYLRKEDAHRT